MINEWVIEYGWCETESGGGYGMYAKLSDKCKEQLGDKVDDDPEFIEDTSRLIAYVLLHSTSMNKKLKNRNRIREDCKRIKKALDNASEDSLNMLVNQFLWHLDDYKLRLQPTDYDPEKDPHGEELKMVVNQLSQLLEDRNPKLQTIDHELVNKQFELAKDLYKEYISENDPYGQDNKHLHSFELPFMEVLQKALLEINNLCSGDGSTLRQEIGRRAKAIFDKFDFHTGTSKTGRFVNYLKAIGKASGFKFDAHSVARTTLQS